uniref:Uncharacterized protein n=1 Tax=Glossina brevipalpis TaxID=37001 RepID=A0A1A9W4T2_9MUSC
MKLGAFLFALFSVATADVSHILSSGRSSSHTSGSTLLATYSVPTSESYENTNGYSALPAYSSQTYSAPATQSHSVSDYKSYTAPAYNSYSSNSAQSYSAPSYGSYSDYVQPAHTYSPSEGYSYKTGYDRAYRRRRDVSHLPPSSYLPPQQEQLKSSTLSKEYLPPKIHAEVDEISEISYSTPDVSSPSFSYSVPTSYNSHNSDFYNGDAAVPLSHDTYSSSSASYSHEYELSEPEPAHTFSETTGYHYKIGGLA